VLDSNGKVGQGMATLFELGLMVNLYLKLNKGTLVLELLDSLCCFFPIFCLKIALDT
jgi:hypothetical protein